MISAACGVVTIGIISVLFCVLTQFYHGLRRLSTPDFRLTIQHSTVSECPFPPKI